MPRESPPFRSGPTGQSATIARASQHSSNADHAVRVFRQGTARETYPSHPRNPFLVAATRTLPLVHAPSGPGLGTCLCFPQHYCSVTCTTSSQIPKISTASSLEVALVLGSAPKPDKIDVGESLVSLSLPRVNFGHLGLMGPHYRLPWRAHPNLSGSTRYC